MPTAIIKIVPIILSFTERSVNQKGMTPKIIILPTPTVNANRCLVTSTPFLCAMKNIAPVTAISTRADNISRFPNDSPEKPNFIYHTHFRKQEQKFSQHRQSYLRYQPLSLCL